MFIGAAFFLQIPFFGHRKGEGEERDEAEL